ncbi:hypothetical protein SSS_04376 [Sarcoptes scabiei]|nr:hypothetical protein SSS_04376 [Sarcoptes scabiei]
MISISSSGGPSTLNDRCQDSNQFDAYIRFGCDCLCEENYSVSKPMYIDQPNLLSRELDYINESLRTIKFDKKVLLITDFNHSKLLTHLKDPRLDRALFVKPNSKDWNFAAKSEMIFKQTDEVKSSHFYPYNFTNELKQYDQAVLVGDCNNTQILTNLNQIFRIDPKRRITEYLDGQKILRKRIAIIEKFKNNLNDSIGFIFLNFKTSIESYLEEVRIICQRIKKSPYFISLNQTDFESRIGNFSQLSAFVVINSCCCDFDFLEKYSKYFYPVISWREFLIVSGKSIEFGGIHWNNGEDSLFIETNSEDNQSSNGNKLIERKLFHQPLSWYGLVVDAGSAGIASTIKEGRKGIASAYVNEQELF